MIADVVTYTNAKIAKIRQEHPSAGTSNKYPYLKDLKDVIPEEIHALFGMMYTRAVLKQNAFISASSNLQSGRVTKSIRVPSHYAGMKIDSQHSETSSIRSTSNVRNCESPRSCYRWTKHSTHIEAGLPSSNTIRTNLPSMVCCIGAFQMQHSHTSTTPWHVPENRTQSHLE